MNKLTKIGIRIMNLKEELKSNGAPKMILAMMMKAKRFSRPGIILSFFVQIFNLGRTCS
jgi:hypothetical protein